MTVLLSVVVMVSFASTALAGPPIAGKYRSYDLPFGSFSTGYFSESWAGPGTHGQIGNTIFAGSWNGVVLGEEWRLWCASIQTLPVLVSDTRDADGTGEVTYETTYSGGHFWVGAVGPWGDENYSGDLGFFRATTTHLYVFGDVLAIRGNMTMMGDFDGYTDCFVVSRNNTAVFGDTDSGSKPPNYPELLDAYCNAGVLTRGAWGTFTEMVFEITLDCGVGMEPSTWGRIKSLYRE